MSTVDLYKDTATRILDAAEALFVENGFEATSLRMITQRAEVNLAAVNYHFGSKEVLFQGVVTRRLAPYNQDCVTELSRAREAAGDARLSVERIIDAFLQPALRLARDPAGSGLLFIRLMSRVFAEPHESLKEILPKQYSGVVEIYLDELHRALPELTMQEVSWRLHFALGTIFYAFAGNDVTRVLLRNNVPGARDTQQIVTQLVPFVIAGFKAPGASAGS